jgi:hypothetical protein
LRDFFILSNVRSSIRCFYMLFAKLSGKCIRASNISFQENNLLGNDVVW